MTHFPLFLNVSSDARILLVGGGAIATAKLESLLPFAPQLFVVARDFSRSMQQALTQHGIAHAKRDYVPEDLAGTRIVIAATDDRTLNAAIATEGRGHGLLVNAVDDAAHCDFIFPALVKRGPVQIAISSSATSPVLARLIKQAIEKVLPWNLERVAEFLYARKKQLHHALPNVQARRLFLESIIDGAIGQQVLEHNDAAAAAAFDAALAAFPNEKRAALYLIGAGPGHPDYITVKGIQLLSQADVVLYDRLVSPQLLERYARRDAEKICVGKQRGAHSYSQAEIDALLAEFLRDGKIVARLKGGDAGIYAHAAEELAIAKAAGAPWQIVPGITAAIGCAAMAGIPLTERDGARAIRLLTLYDHDMHDAAFWRNLAEAKDETLVFYMSTAQRREMCSNLLAAGFAPETPIMAVEQGTTPAHREYAATLETFGEFYGDYPFLSPTLFIVGDVVRWRAAHAWREPAQAGSRYFPQHAGSHAAS